MRAKVEVFRTHDGRGWGLRAARYIFVGDFVCEYVGKIYTSLEYDQRDSASSYTWNLDHFIMDALTESNNSFADRHECWAQTCASTP